MKVVRMNANERDEGKGVKAIGEIREERQTHIVT